MPTPSAYDIALKVTEQQIKDADEMLRRALGADRRVDEGGLLAGVLTALAINFATEREQLRHERRMDP